MAKEIRIPFDQIQDPQAITPAMEREFAKHDLNLHINDVVSLEDDHQRKERVVNVKNTKYFFQS